MGKKHASQYANFGWLPMMKISRRFREDTDFDNPDSECHGMSGQMKRQMDAMTALRSLMVVSFQF